MTIETMMTEAEFLEHAGVKGMKWGVRKSEPIATKHERTPAEKAALRKNVLIGTGIALAVGAVAVGIILNRPIILENLEIKKASKLLMSDIKDNPGVEVLADKGHRFINDYVSHDVNIPAGLKFQRVAKTLETSISSPKYASYIKEDVLTYRSRFTSPFAAAGSKAFKTSFETVANTKVAGNDSLVRNATRLASTNSKLSGLMRAEAIANYKGQPNYAFMKDQIVKSSTSEVADTWLTLNAGKAWTSPMAKKLISGLSEEGYVGFTDNVDSAGMSKHAVVLINNAMVKTTGSALSDTDIKAAATILTKFGSG